jgi:hypothetical protein
VLLFERHLLLPMQPDPGYLQVRIHEGRLLHQLLERRQGLLRDDPSLLQLLVPMLRERLLLLHLLQQHAGLLRQLRLIELKSGFARRFVGPQTVATKKPREIDGQAVDLAGAVYWPQTFLLRLLSFCEFSYLRTYIARHRTYCRSGALSERVAVAEP